MYDLLTPITITLPLNNVLVIQAALKTLRDKLPFRWHPVFDELLEIFTKAASNAKV